MSRNSFHRHLKHLVLGATAATMALVASPETASADTYVRVGGSVRIGPAGTFYRPPVRVRRVRRIYRPIPARRLVVGGSLWAGNLTIGWAAPPPPVQPCPVDCGPPPPPPPRAYYGPGYYRPAPAPVIRRPAPRPLVPRFGLGIFGGGVDVEDREAGEAFGLIGRYNVGRHLALEGELSRDEIENDVRIDNRAGGALILNLLPHRRLNPYVLAGGGVLFTDVADGQYSSRDPYGEAGIGIELKLSHRLSLSLEGRAGARRRASGGDPGETPLRAIAPPADEEEGYTRGRLAAMLYF